MRAASLLLTVLLFAGCAVRATAPPPLPNVDEPAPLVVMNLAAHPDDEDGATMAYYRYAKDAVVHSVIFTRGEGGQNEIGPELYEALGAIRTDETERAARHLGTQVHFLNFKDFGYSKIAEEAFERWGGRDVVTARLVYLIRQLKPDVLFTNHDTLRTGPRAQHGHHQAVGLAAHDAFTLAADPTYHPDHLEEDGVDLWQPKRLFLRDFLAEAEHDVSVPVGEVYAPRGKSYAALAADALTEHASQGMDRFADRIRALEATHFELQRSATEAPPTPQDLAGNLPPHPAPPLSIAYLIDSGRVPALPAGMVVPDDSLAVPGQRIRLRWDPKRLPEQRLRLRISGAIDTTLHLDEATPGLTLLTVPTSATPTFPPKVYQYERFASHPPVTYAAFRAGTDSLVAAGYLPLELAPPLHVEMTQPVVRLESGTNLLPVQARVFDPAAERLAVNVAISRDADRRVLVQQQHALAYTPDVVVADTLSVDLPDTLQNGDYTITLTGLALPATGTARPAVAHATGRAFEVEVADGLRVGVIESYDNTLTQALSELDVDHVLLDSTDLAEQHFENLHTIVVDIRAYLVREDLRTHNDALLDWVRDGGHLLVNYQKTFEWNTNYRDPFDGSRNNPGDFAPYPLVLGRERVTREEAPVAVQLPDHVLFRTPNAITGTVWAGWVQERGLYFPRTWDAAYTELFCLNDPGEAPHCGSTLLAEVDDGTYLYTALVWYRQLNAFHPGAYAMFANMISLPLTADRVAASPP